MSHKNLIEKREYWNKWYRRQPLGSRYRKSQTLYKKIRRKATHDFIDEYKKNNPCLCGEGDPRCLDFHHVSGKIFNIGDAVRHGLSIEKIVLEIKKCVVMCANCHRKMGR